MAFSENLASFHQWSTFCPSSFTDSFFSDVFTHHRETETLTKALQQSLSRDDSETLADTTNTSSFNQNHFNITPENQTPTRSGSDPETTSKRRNSSISNGKITKRKSRATKRSPITFITADPTNFRQMVQQVTGIRMGNNNNSNEHLPVTSVVKPEAKRPGDLVSNYFLPTLDTSEFLLHQQQQQQQSPPQIVSSTTTGSSSQGLDSNFTFTQRGENGVVGLDFDSYQSFPTLESWGVI